MNNVTPTVGSIHIIHEKAKAERISPKMRALLMTVRSACIMVAKAIEAYLQDC